MSKFRQGEPSICLFNQKEKKGAGDRWKEKMALFTLHQDNNERGGGAGRRGEGKGNTEVKEMAWRNYFSPALIAELMNRITVDPHQLFTA